MGVHNLMKLIIKYAPKSVNARALDHYKGKYLAIDTSLV